MSTLKVSVVAGMAGPVLVLAGEADITSLPRLDEALTSQTSRPGVQLIIDATDLCYADSASMRALVLAAEKIRTQDGTVTLLNPQPPVARLLDLLGIDDMVTVRTQPAASGSGAPVPGPAA